MEAVEKIMSILNVKNENEMLDPRGSNYVYKINKYKKSFTLSSYGADKKEGGTGYNKDIIHETPFQ